MTQEKVAEHLGKPQCFVSKVETGERRIDPTELEKFAKLYGKPVTFSPRPSRARFRRSLKVAGAGRGS